MKLNLVVLTPGKTAGQTIPVNRAQFSIGRDPGCQLRPNSSQVSNHHCTLVERAGHIYVLDAGSMNGTYVNDKPVQSIAELHDRDRLRVGPLLFGIRFESCSPGNQSRLAEPGPAATGTRDNMAAGRSSLPKDDRHLQEGADAEGEEVPNRETKLDILAISPLSEQAETRVEIARQSPSSSIRATGVDPDAAAGAISKKYQGPGKSIPCPSSAAAAADAILKQYLHETHHKKHLHRRHP